MKAFAILGILVFIVISAPMAAAQAPSQKRPETAKAEWEKLSQIGS